MKITRVEVVHSKKQVTLSEDYLPAWREPDGTPTRRFGFSYYKIHTDEGVTGVGPYTGEPDSFSTSALIGMSPFHVEWFWNVCMAGRELPFNRCNYSGLEIALWDIIGKSADKPLYKILGARREKIMAYAATNRLLKTDDHIKQVLEIMEMGFKAVKLRLHRPDPKDDLNVVKSVRDAVGDDLTLMVDANQNNVSLGYNFWSRKTALWMAKELDKLNVYFLEEPLARRDVEGLAELARSVEMLIAGGEHATNIYEYRDHILRDAYDVLQPDVRLGDMGITGLRKTAIVADYFNKIVIPHVCSSGSLALGLPATLQAMATVENCPMVEYPIEPPILTAENQQLICKEPILVDKTGFLKVPERPGIGVELYEE
jgi:L-alanine-DL-glutamate epimerase-like enolase superfamily enzyme